jgi:hypothetical protein
MVAIACIGSRSTPAQILEQLPQLASLLAGRCTVRSGHAPGFDQAIERAILKLNGSLESYLPWRNFEGADDSPQYCSYIPQRAMEIAAEWHPAWDRLSDGGKKLMARNSQQILGRHCTEPAAGVVCWSPGYGGTEQGLRIARAYRIPICNYYLAGAGDILKNVQTWVK